MSERHDDYDGSDIFWPGYVDATTNLILNLLFLLTILIVAVFMFALEMGRTAQVDQEISSVAAIPQIVVGSDKPAMDAVQETIALKREIERLKKLLAEQDTPSTAGQAAKVVEVKAKTLKPASGLEKTYANDFELVIRFKDEAIEFTPEEHDRLITALQPVLARGQVGIFVEVPVGFSEAKRLGFYRALAVRNLLIEMKHPKEKIDVSVVEGKTSASASIVRVRAR
jgi:hypothetical protein